ncbi:MAG: hypothetical protein J6581_09890 [Apibacter sp.]|nr:hypothetical protein [Apibacter sp.]
MNGLTQGIIQGISGGDILQGISSGSISSLVSTAVGMGGTAAGVDGTKIGGTLFFGSVSGGFGAVLTNGNFWQGAATGLIVSGLNHVAHRADPPVKKSKNKKVIDSNLGAVNHYFNGDGEPVELGTNTKKAVLRNKRTRNVVTKLIEGKAERKTYWYGIDLTNDMFHVGRTNVEYATTCNSTKCTTKFKAFVKDGFWDPIDLKIELPGGKPYSYIPWEFSITYKNPGYSVGTNIK